MYIVGMCMYNRCWPSATWAQLVSAIAHRCPFPKALLDLKKVKDEAEAAQIKAESQACTGTWSCEKPAGIRRAKSPELGIWNPKLPELRAFCFNIPLKFDGWLLLFFCYFRLCPCRCV